MTPNERLWKLRTRPWLFGADRRDAEIAEIFQELVTAGDQRSMLSQVPQFITDISAEVRLATARALHQILSAVQPVEYLAFSERLEASLRWCDYPGTNEAWRTLQPSKLSEIAEDEETRASVFGFASFHRNGFVRHEAVRQLSRIHDGTELPFLLIRQNDWVAPVSADARIAVQERLTSEYLPHFLTNLPLVFHLLVYQRHDHSELVARIVGLLLQPDFDSLLVSAIQNPVRQVCREIIRIALELEGEHILRVVKHGLISADSTIRLWCLRRLPRSLAGNVLRETLSFHKHDRFMPVRREAMQIDANAFPESEVDVWTTGLLDSNSSLRELAQIRFAKLVGHSAASFYRNTLIENPNSVAALSGLGETGEKSDLPAIRAHVGSPQSKQRAAAANGLFRIGGDSVVPELVDILQDDSAAVVRTVRKLLERVPHLVAGERLLAVTTNDHRSHVRRASIQLLCEKGKWAGLTWLILD